MKNDILHTAGPGGLFVAIWSTGFVLGRVIVPVASPALFLTARFLLAAALFAILAVATRVRWPHPLAWPQHLLAGVLLNGVYLAGGYEAVARGLSPAVMALLGTLQPVLSALAGILLFGERPGRLFWYGLVAGVGGVLLVLLPALAVARDAVAPAVVATGLVAVLSLTAGTVLQKTRLARADLFASCVLQSAGGALFTGVLAVVQPDGRWQSGVLLYGALAWGALVLSGAGTGLLLWLVRRGKIGRVASLMYLAPPLAAVESWLLFGMRPAPVQLAGFVLALSGVWLCHVGGGPAGHVGRH